MSARCVAYIGAGANLGDRAATLRGAMDALDAVANARVSAMSSLYETEPVGGVQQPAYLNMAARIETTLSPEALLGELQKIERTFGRRREGEIRWGPRTLDLDLLLFGNETRQTESLTLPHPRMWERAFVLIPLREVADAELAEKLEAFPKSDTTVRLYQAGQCF